MSDRCHLSWENISHSRLRPLTPVTSPPFLYRGREWRLLYRLEDGNRQDPAENPGGGVLYLDCLDTGGEELGQPFSVDCCAKFVDQDGVVVSAANNEIFHRKTCSSWSNLPLKMWDATIELLCSSPNLFSEGEANFVLAFDGVGASEDFGLQKEADNANRDPTPDLEGLSSDLWKLLATEEAADLKLKCGSVVRSVHRSVLAARSEVFAAMLLRWNSVEENKSGTLDLSDEVDPTALEIFLRYVYSGKLAEDLDNEKLANVYVMSDKYAVLLLKKLCYERMVQLMSEDNYAALLQLADQHQDLDFKEYLILKMLEDHRDWLMSDSWLSFSRLFPALACEIYQKIIPECLKNPRQS